MTGHGGMERHVTRKEAETKSALKRDLELAGRRRAIKTPNHESGTDSFPIPAACNEQSVAATKITTEY